MRISPLKISDMPQLVHLAKQHTYPLLSRKNIISEGVIRDSKDELIGYGITKAFAEAVIILDKNMSAVQRGKILITLLNGAIADAHAKDIEQLHVFIQDSPPGYEDILKKHFHFQDCSGTPLVLNLE